MGAIQYYKRYGKNVTTIKELKGIQVKKGKRFPHSIGKIRDVVFYPDRKCVAGFVTKQSDLLLVIRRKGHFVSISGYYMHEDIAFVRQEEGSSGKDAYMLLGLQPDESVKWLGLPIFTESGQSVGTVSDVSFIDQNGEVQSIESSTGALGKLFDGTRTIPVSLIIGYSDEMSTSLVSVNTNDESNSSNSTSFILVSNEALEIAFDTNKAFVPRVGKQVSTIAQNAGVDTAAVSEKTKSAAKTAGAVVHVGTRATAKQLKKTKGMFSAFKDEYNKARHDE